MFTRVEKNMTCKPHVIEIDLSKQPESCDFYSMKETRILYCIKCNIKVKAIIHCNIGEM